MTRRIAASMTSVLLAVGGVFATDVRYEVVFDATWSAETHPQDFPDGETGFTSVLQAGVMVDHRDSEIAPTRGYWAEASVRAASWLWGSQWSYVGANLILRGLLDLHLTFDKVSSGSISRCAPSRYALPPRGLWWLSLE